MEKILTETQRKRRCVECVFTRPSNKLVFRSRGKDYKATEVWHNLVQDLKEIEIAHVKRPPPAGIRDSYMLHDHAEIAPSEFHNFKDPSLVNGIYHPLHNGNTIRLLELLPGRYDDPIVCRFSYDNLHQPCLRYTALSYVWGKKTFVYWDSTTHKSQEAVCIAECNGVKRNVTLNLDSALRHIRSSSNSMILWIDALCINQDDGKERAHQITLMGSIYRNAHRVLIWLGEREGKDKCGRDDERAGRAFRAICDIVNRWQGSAGIERVGYTIRNGRGVTQDTFEDTPSSAIDRDHPKQTSKNVNPDSPKPTLPAQPFYKYEDGLDFSKESAPSSEFWISIANLFNRSWFWRVWVVQEAVLARAATVKWGNVEIEWHLVGAAAALIRTNYREVCEEMQIGGIYNAYLMFRLSTMSNLPPPMLSFHHLLRLTRQFEATDPRDHVYGILGLNIDGKITNTTSSYLVPDYHITHTELWKRIAWKIILDSQNLSILSNVQHTEGNYKRERGRIWVRPGALRIFDTLQRKKIDDDGESPSWVPRWDLVCRMTLASWDVNKTFEAASGFPLKLLAAEQENSDMLSVKGIEVGIVGLVGVCEPHKIDLSFLESPNLATFFTTESGLQLLAQTFTAGKNDYGSLERSPMEALHSLAAFIMEVQDPVSHTPYPRKDVRAIRHMLDKDPGLENLLRSLAARGSPSQFRTSAFSACSRRRLFLTLNGFLGLAPDTVQEGDILTVLSGGDVPFLLRPADEMDEGSLDPGSEASESRKLTPKLYHLVGECYVCNLMSGEAVHAAHESIQLSGPIPTTLIHDEIMAKADFPDTPEHAPQNELWVGVGNGKMGADKIEVERLRRGYFKFDILDSQSRVKAEKKRFDIR
ncbi:heterokaryon incompatibility protein-domain-containing protein [Clohesyomyces aquaticus]|uniref:Heterokaryon incompatibility protein-domain-containing protein n=1 Tax=Clohesyomyces aquaticus TaxID=1231657 RepID=A0A1Y2A323_9PLEO|nr:heterokaryon incompatibility protein-domain-containing protein [Clohesyomyces aquaticus]